MVSTTSLFEREDYQQLCRDYDTITKRNDGDKFAVKEGKLIITKAGYLQAPIRTVKNLIYGGYNRYAVASYLEKVVEKTQDFIKELKEQPDYLKNYNAEVRLLKKRIKEVASVVSSVGYGYRGSWLSENKGSKKFSALYNTFDNLHRDLKEKLKDIPKSSIKSPSQQEPIDDYRVIDLTKIKAHLPSNQTPEETVKLAQKAASQEVPTWKKVGAIALVIIGTAIMFYPLSILNGFKWFIWNPIEFIVKREITTNNPINWWILSTFHFLNSYISNQPKEAQARYADQLLWAPIITDDHVKAFGQLAHHLKEVDLTCIRPGSKNLDELLLLIEKKDEEFFKKRFQEIVNNAEIKSFLEQLINQSNIELIYPDRFFGFLIKFSFQAKWTIDLNEECTPDWQEDYSKMFNDIDTLENRKKYLKDKLLKDNPTNQYNFDYNSKSSPIISYANLCKIIEMASSNPNCRKISLPHHYYCYHWPSIKASLEKNGFKQEKETLWIR